MSSRCAKNSTSVAPNRLRVSSATARTGIWQWLSGAKAFSWPLANRARSPDKGKLMVLGSLGGKVGLSETYLLSFRGSNIWMFYWGTIHWPTDFLRRVHAGG